VRLRLACVLAALAAAPTQAAGAAAPPMPRAAPVSAHAMVHTCCTPLPMKERLFAEAKAMGARFIRVDVELSGIFPTAGTSPADADWTRLDEVLELSRRHDLPVLGLLLSPPPGAAADHPQAFGRLAGEVAGHAGGTIKHWEILNEPDGSWAFSGTPEQYAGMLRAAHDAIKARVPDARIALGAIMSPLSLDWLERVFAAPGANAVRAFDVANVNLRGTTRQVEVWLGLWRQMLERHGFTGPVWVAEHGYSGDSAYQTDGLFRGGEPAQAAYLTESVLALAAAGADQVFVTLRDNLWGRFLSEGVVAIDEASPQFARRKPAFAAVRRLADRWPALAPAYAERRHHADAARAMQALAAAAARNVAAQRRLARATRVRLRRARSRHRRALRSDAVTSTSRARIRSQVARATADLRERRTGVGWAKASAADYRARATLNALRARELAAFVAGG
jgi:hypothetical protein